MIKLENVTKLYGDKIGLEHANIQINDGEFVFVVGPSGAGKSTFIRLILRELLPDDGHIWVDGEDITKYSNRQIPKYRRRIGMVFQDFKLLPNKTVFENIALALEVTHATKRTIRRQVPQVLQLMGIKDKIDSFPDELSAGEQQRVAIARALVNRPSFIIADEPTGNVDPELAWEVMQLLAQINARGTTVLMVTHAEDLVNRMQKRVVTIDNGRIVNDQQEGGYSYGI